MHIHPGMVNTPLVKPHWTIRPLFTLLGHFATTPEDCAEYMLYGLFQSDKGACRRSTRGDDIGKYRYYGSEEARKRVWEHSKEEVENALNKQID